MSKNYGFLGQVAHVPTRNALKLILDRLGSAEDRVTAAAAQAAAASTGGLTQTQVQAIVDSAIRLAARAGTVPAPPVSPPSTTPSAPSSSAPSPTAPSGLVCYTTVAGGQPGGVPASPNLRWFRGDFCGVEVPGLPAVAGGAVAPSTVFSSFIDRYSAANRAAIYAAMHVRGYTHFVLSWPDSRSGNGQSVAQFVATCQEVQANGFYPCIFLTSKDWDTADVATIMADLNVTLPALLAGGCIPIACVGWELSIWLTPTQVQDLIDAISALVVPTANLYVHFQEDYTAFQQPGEVTAAFWNLNVGKLTGLWHEKQLTQDCGYYQARIADGTGRFAGNFGYAADSGFGHPFDYVAFEYSASPRFANGITEADAIQIGLQAISAPYTTGPAGAVGVMGFCNGGPNV